MMASNNDHPDNDGLRIRDAPHAAVAGRPAPDQAAADVTAADEAGAAMIGGGMQPAWYAKWLDAGFSHAEIEEWWPVTSYRSYGPDAAVVLRSVGLTPPGFLAIAMKLIDVPRDPADEPDISLDAISAANTALVWQEVAEFLQFRRDIAFGRRNSSLSIARDAGATAPDLAARFGWSKQRIHQLTPSGVKRKYRSG